MPGDLACRRSTERAERLTETADKGMGAVGRATSQLHQCCDAMLVDLFDRSTCGDGFGVGEIAGGTLES